MSFVEYKDAISEGDIALAWITRTSSKPLVIDKTETFNTKYGPFPHDKMIGVRYGTQVPSSSKAGFLHVLAPTPELWTMSLPHRTQIVYTPDSSYIVQRLRIRPGSRVLEAGTGSGSFTHGMSRTVARTGKVFTYEFHEHRYKEAQTEIKDHGLTNVTITHRDVCKSGFKLDLSLQNTEEGRLDATAVFLDLPSPWLAIPHLKSVVSTTRATHICCFSPCIEQVVKTVEALKKEGWQHIEMVEVSAKRWEGHKEMVKTIDDAMERLRDVKRRRLAGLQKRNERIKKQKADASAVTETEADTATESADPEPKNEQQHNAPKNRGYNPWGKGMRIKEGAEGYEWRNVSRVETEIKSHTSYLTFAVLPPPVPSNLVDENGNVLSSLENK